MKKAANTDMCMCLEIHDHVYQMMFTNAFSCISCTTNVVITTSVYCQLLSYCSNTAAINKLN